MATVYSILVQASIGLNGTLTLTVPAGYKWILRDFDVYWGGGAIAKTVYLRGTAGQAIWFNGFAIGGGQYASWRGRQVINPGKTCAIVTNDAMDVTLSGYQLTLP